MIIPNYCMSPKSPFDGALYPISDRELEAFAESIGAPTSTPWISNTKQ